jgi:glycosyltransferase involved in cell wall biosynthesis
MRSLPRVAFVSLFNPHHGGYQWSGTNKFLFQTLRESFAGAFYADIGQRYNLRYGAERAYHKLCRRLGRRSGHVYADDGYARFLGERLQRALAGKAYDVVVSITPTPLRHFETDRPVVLFSDCTWRNIVNYYDVFANLTDDAVRTGDEIQRDVLQRVDAAVYSSEWATRSAVNDYQTRRDRVFQIPLGANIDDAVVPSRVEPLVRPRGDCCRLLFVGVEWARKGGDKAVAVLDELRALGVPARLTVVGCRPPAELAHPHVEILPAIDKFAPGGMEAFARLYRSADYFVLPTEVECFGVVFSEASAFAVPSFTHDTGGVASAVRDGVNGKLFALDASPAAMARAIADNWSSEADRIALRRSTKYHYESHLAWRNVGRRLLEVVRAMA